MYRRRSHTKKNYIYNNKSHTITCICAYGGIQQYRIRNQPCRQIEGRIHDDSGRTNGDRTGRARAKRRHSRFNGTCQLLSGQGSETKGGSTGVDVMQQASELAAKKKETDNSRTYSTHAFPACLFARHNAWKCVLAVLQYETSVEKKNQAVYIHAA